jgi:hypothetical protein
MSKSDEPRELEVVSGGAVSKETAERSLLRVGFSRFLFRAKHETAVTNANAEHVEAQARLGQALEGLERTASRLGDLPTILAGDKAGRDTVRLALENQRDQEARTAKTRELRDTIEQEELELHLAELRARRKTLAEPAAPKPSAARSLIDEQLGELRTVAEIQAEGERMINELLSSIQGEVPPDIAREVENIHDAVKALVRSL